MSHPTETTCAPAGDPEAPTAPDAAGRTLTFAITLAAAPERVRRAWTDPAWLARWWGPHWFAAVPIDRTPPESATHVLENRSHPAVRIRLTLAPAGPATAARLGLEFASATACARARAVVGEQIRQHFAALAAIL